MLEYQPKKDGRNSRRSSLLSKFNNHSCEFCGEDENVVLMYYPHHKKIRSLYSNLDTISFWKLENEIELLEERGYSTKAMHSKLHRSLAFPLFLLSMVLLSGVFTLGMQSKESNWTYVFLSLIHI